MDIMDIASKYIVSKTQKYGKKLQKEMSEPPIDKVQPYTINGEKYNVGFATAEVMPDLSGDKTYWIAGHGSGHKMEGVLTPVSVSAMWFDCGTGEGFVWVCADIIGLTRVEVQTVRGMLADFSKKSGCKFINISCSHSHSGIDTIGYWGKPNLVSIPSDGKDPDYMKLLFNRICEVCEKAYENRKPGKLYLGTVNVPGAQFAKRLLGKLNDTLTRFRFVPEDGGRESWLVNFAGHPNSLGGSNRMLSGEYPYFLRETVKNGCGADIMFGNGAVGALDLAQLDENDNVENIKKQGKMLGEAAMSVCNDEELKPEITLLNQPFYMPASNYVLTLLAMRKTMNTDAYPDTRGDVGIALKSEMTYLKIGKQQILMLPGENFSPTIYGDYIGAEESCTGKGGEINPKPLVDVAGDKNLLVFGISNDMTGYVVPPNDFLLNPTQPYLNGYKDKFGKNHYHETNSLGKNIQQVLVDEFTDIMSRVK